MEPEFFIIGFATTSILRGRELTCEARNCLVTFFQARPSESHMTFSSLVMALEHNLTRLQVDHAMAATVRIGTETKMTTIAGSGALIDRDRPRSVAHASERAGRGGIDNARAKSGV